MLAQRIAARDPLPVFRGVHAIAVRAGRRCFLPPSFLHASFARILARRRFSQRTTSRIGCTRDPRIARVILYAVHRVCLCIYRAMTIRTPLAIILFSVAVLMALLALAGCVDQQG